MPVLLSPVFTGWSWLLSLGSFLLLLIPAIDPGHAGPASCAGPVVVFSGHVSGKNIAASSRGTLSAGGLYEFWFNDEVTRLFPCKGSSGLKFVRLPSTRNIPLFQRVPLAERLKAKLIVEIHHDSGPPELADTLRNASPGDPILDFYQGFSLHVFPNERSIGLARSIEARIIEAGIVVGTYLAETPDAGICLIPGTRAIYARPNLRVLRTATVPAVIVECGCIANPVEEKLLKQKEYRERLVRAIRMGIEDFCCEENRRKSDLPEKSLPR